MNNAVGCAIVVVLCIIGYNLNRAADVLEDLAIDIHDFHMGSSAIVCQTAEIHAGTKFDPIVADVTACRITSIHDLIFSRRQ